MSIHSIIELMVGLGMIRPAQAEDADRYADELTARVERGEITLDQACELMATRAHVHNAENQGSS